jgi:lysophospholipase L1-like esterase
MNRLAFAFLFLCAAFLRGAETPASFPIEVKPADVRLHYNGRFDWRAPDAPRMTFPACNLVVRFHGTGLAALLGTTIADRIQVVVDGRPAAVLALGKEPALFVAAQDLSPGDHTVVLFKATEAVHGTTAIYGLRLPAGAVLLDAPRSARLIEFIGDSITCGYGDEAANKEEKFSPDNSNSYYAYGALAARALGADQTGVAVSGIRLTATPDRPAMPAVYPRVDLFDADLPWDFNREPAPDVVVINLATNDFGRDRPDEALWKGTYNRFLDTVRSRRPSALILLTDGPMMPLDENLANVRRWNRDIVAARRAAGDTRIEALSYPVQDPADGYGSDWHPSLVTHAKMAARLAAAIRTAEGW